MKSKDWKLMQFEYPENIPTMISAEEKCYLYWLGKSEWKGIGTVVEIGPWLGGSTVCLAAGMKASGGLYKKKLKVFDNYLWREFMQDIAPLPIETGGSFESYFLSNIKNYDDVVQSYCRTLPDEVIELNNEASSKRYGTEEKIDVFDNFSDGPIEILFIDGAKSWRGMRHLLKILNKDFIPGKTLLVCQDYKYWGCYWVPLMLSRLQNYLEPVHQVHDGSTVAFRLVAEIPETLIDTMEQHVSDIDTAVALEHIVVASKISENDGDNNGKNNILLGKVKFLSHQGKNEEALIEFDMQEKLWRTFSNTAQLTEARNYIQKELKNFRKVPFRFTAARYIMKIPNKIHQFLRRI